jgi:hypothetical protein
MQGKEKIYQYFLSLEYKNNKKRLRGKCYIKMTTRLSKTTLVILILVTLSITMDPSSAHIRHRRDNDGGAKEASGTKKKKKEDTCVYGYCLDPSYNTLELPSKVTATHIKMNLEVSS